MLETKALCRRLDQSLYTKLVANATAKVGTKD